MAKKASRAKRTSSGRLPPPDTLDIDLTKFKPDLTAADIKKALTPVRLKDLPSLIFPTIDVISPTRTIGLGRTNLTLVRPVILQTDATPAFASFDRLAATAQQPPTVSVHFEPSKYGLTGNVTFLLRFSLEAFGAVNINVGAFAGAGTISGVGPRTINGQQIVSILFSKVPATQQVFGHVTQTGGATWRWFQTRISFLPLIIKI